MSAWRWEVHDQHGEPRGVRDLSDPFASTPEEAADLIMAKLMIRAAPHYERLRGWRVRAWADGAGEASVSADEWLRTAEAAGR